MRIFDLLTLMLAVAVCGTAASAADSVSDYPVRPIRMIVTNAPGSAVDILSRIVAVRLGNLLGEQVVMDDHSGAGSLVAHQGRATARDRPQPAKAHAAARRSARHCGNNSGLRLQRLEQPDRAARHAAARPRQVARGIAQNHEPSRSEGRFRRASHRGRHQHSRGITQAGAERTQEIRRGGESGGAEGRITALASLQRNV